MILIDFVPWQSIALSVAMNEKKKGEKLPREKESTVELMHGLFVQRFRYRFDKLLINGMKSAGAFGTLACSVSSAILYFEWKSSC